MTTTQNTTIEATANNVRATKTGVDGGLDIDVAVTIDGVSYEGEVTLVRDHGDEWRAYGPSADYWISGALLAQLERLGADRMREALRAIEGAAAAACEGAVGAIAAGERDGVEDVETVLAEQGIDAVIATLEPGHEAWDEGAINACAAEEMGIPKHLQDLYYGAYARAARARAEELRDTRGHLAVGDRVEGGEPGTEDYDTGRVLAIDGDRVRVGWGSGVVCWHDRDELRAL